MSLNTQNIFQIIVMLVGQGRYEVEISHSGVGSITRLENFINSMEEKLEAAKTRTKDLLGQLESDKQEESRPFEYVSKIQELTKELA